MTWADHFVGQATHKTKKTDRMEDNTVPSSRFKRVGEKSVKLLPLPGFKPITMNWGWTAQLVECQTKKHGTILIQVQFPDVARVFSPPVNFQ